MSVIQNNIYLNPILLYFCSSTNSSISRRRSRNNGSFDEKRTVTAVKCFLPEMLLQALTLKQTNGCNGVFSSSIQRCSLYIKHNCQLIPKCHHNYSVS